MTTNEEKEEPASLICPITKCMFKSPVYLCETGNTYEHEALVRFWSNSSIRDPLTNVKLKNNTCFSINWGKRREVKQYLDNHPGYKPSGWSSPELPTIENLSRRRSSQLIRLTLLKHKKKLLLISFFVCFGVWFLTRKKLILTNLNEYKKKTYDLYDLYETPKVIYFHILSKLLHKGEFSFNILFEFVFLLIWCFISFKSTIKLFFGSENEFSLDTMIRNSLLISPFNYIAYELISSFVSSNLLSVVLQVTQNIDTTDTRNDKDSVSQPIITVTYLLLNRIVSQKTNIDLNDLKIDYISIYDAVSSSSIISNIFSNYL